MTIDTQQLRELAQKATPGHWYSKWPEERCTWVDVGDSRYPVAYTGDCFDDAPNAEYIAAANPATVLALLDDLARTQGSLVIASAALSAAERKLQSLRTIESAARNLAKVKGRHNSELAMNQLLEALK